MGMMVGANGAVIRTADPYGTQKKNTRSIQTTKNKKKKYKKLNYNYREVSGRILRAKTSISARQAAVHARTVVAMLRRRYGCGEYNDRELEIAIVHAEKMVRIAKKKLKNLRMEELARRTSEAEKIREEREGGEKEIGSDYYELLNRSIAESGYVDLIDVEAFGKEATAARIIAAAHGCGAFSWARTACAAFRRPAAGSPPVRLPRRRACLCHVRPWTLRPVRL